MASNRSGFGYTAGTVLRLPTLYRGVHTKGTQQARLTADLQQYLRGRLSNERPPIVVDGEFGAKTEEFVKKLQRQEHVEDDGVVGATTWGKLLAAGFRPSDYEAEQVPGDNKKTAAWPGKPAGVRVPSGMTLFGKGFTYTATPTQTNPESISIAQSWVTANIGTARVPQLRGVPGMVRDSGSLPFNKLAIPQLEAMFELWEKLELHKLVLSFGGSWSPRFIRGSKTALSNHAFGSALDINVPWNPYKTQPALVGKTGSVRELVPSAFAMGFYWGGWYNDGMHFEVFKILSAEEIDKVTREFMQP